MPSTHALNALSMPPNHIHHLPFSICRTKADDLNGRHTGFLTVFGCSMSALLGLLVYGRLSCMERGEQCRTRFPYTLHLRGQKSNNFLAECGKSRQFGVLATSVVRNVQRATPLLEVPFGKFQQLVGVSEERFPLFQCVMKQAKQRTNDH